MRYLFNDRAVCNFSNIELGSFMRRLGIDLNTA